MCVSIWGDGWIGGNREEKGTGKSEKCQQAQKSVMGMKGVSIEEAQEKGRRERTDYVYRYDKREKEKRERIKYKTE